MYKFRKSEAITEHIIVNRSFCHEVYEYNSFDTYFWHKFTRCETSELFVGQKVFQVESMKD
jgi:hypothetical protein